MYNGSRGVNSPAEESLYYVSSLKRRSVRSRCLIFSNYLVCLRKNAQIMIGAADNERTGVFAEGNSLDFLLDVELL